MSTHHASPTRPAASIDSTPVPFTGSPNDLVSQHGTAAVYTVAEVAELLSLSLGSTYALVRAGRIPAKKIGARWVIPKRRFHSWLDADDPAGDGAEQVGGQERHGIRGGR